MAKLTGGTLTAAPRRKAQLKLRLTIARVCWVAQAATRRHMHEANAFSNDRKL